jgi:hypothetical protein
MPENQNCQYVDDLVSEVSPLPNRRIKLSKLISVPGSKQSFLFVWFPPEYRNPQKGDRIRIRLERTVDPVPVWSAHVCIGPGHKE